jgi:hypothetical protein
MVVHTYHTSYMGNRNRKILVQVGLGIKWDPITKKAEAKRAGDVAQVVVSSKLKALRATPVLPCVYTLIKSICMAKENYKQSKKTCPVDRNKSPLKSQWANPSDVQNTSLNQLGG